MQTNLERDSFSRRMFLGGGTGAAMLAVLGANAAPQPGMTAFVGARLIDGNGGAPLAGAVVLIAADRIIAAGDARSFAIPSDARRIDVSGKTIMPALIDAHTHVGIVEGTSVSPDNYGPASVAANLAAFGRYGVGAVLIMGTDRNADAVRTYARNSTATPTTHLESGGPGFGVPDGYPPPHMIGAPWIARPATPAAAREAVRVLSAQSPDIVKLWVDSGFGQHPTMDRAVSAAIIDEAHRRGLRTAAHIFYQDDARALVEQGLDVLAHSVRDVEIDDALLADLRRRDVGYITTLTLDESQYVYADEPRPAFTTEPAFNAALEPAVAAELASPHYRERKRSSPDTPKWRAAARMSKHNALRVLRAGVTIAAGTDAGATFERIRGFDAHRELELLVASGLRPLEAITCGTVNAARVLGPRAADLGAIEPGKRANLLVLDGDPSVVITATRGIDQIWQSGVRVPSWRDR